MGESSEEFHDAHSHLTERREDEKDEEEERKGSGEASEEDGVGGDEAMQIV